jgi:hypothetical protein
MATEDEIRQLKERHGGRLLAHRSVNSVGVERDEGGEYALTVDVSGDASDLPRELDGHPIRYVSRGPYVKQ